MTLIAKITSEYLAQRNECIERGICIECGGSASEFRDDFSRDEYHISALCQTCQDEIFDDMPEDALVPEDEKDFEKECG